MEYVLKIARSSKTNKVYACIDLGYDKVFLPIVDVVKLTGIAFADVNYVDLDNPMLYEINLQAVSK